MAEEDARAADAPEFTNDLRSAVELLRATVADNGDDLGQWQAVYGVLQSGFPREVTEPIARRAAESFRGVRDEADLAEAVGTVVREIVELLSGTASRLFTTTVAAHVAVEKKLLEDLAVATGRTTDDVLDDVDVWISDVTFGE